MNTVEIVVMFEEAKLDMEAEKQRISDIKMLSNIEQLKKLEMLECQIKSEAEKLKDEIKAEMQKRNTEEMAIGQYIVRWTEVLSNRFDSTKFKKMFPSMYKEFTKEVSSRRFSIV